VDVASIAGGVTPRVTTDAGAPHWHHDGAALERAPRWAVDSEPLVVIGGSQGDPNFEVTFVERVLLLDDGRVVALSRIDNRVMLFARNGMATDRWGKTGRDTGDFMAPAGLLRAAADTLLVPDPGNARLNWMTLDSGVVRAAAFAARPAGPGLLEVPGRVGERLVVLMPRPDRAPGGVVHAGADVLAQRPDGRDHIPIASLRGPVTVPVETRFRGRVRVEQELPRLSFAPQAAVWDSLIVTTDGPGFALRLWSAAGSPRGAITIDAPRRAVSPLIRSTLVDRELDRLTGSPTQREVDPAEARRLAEIRPFADSLGAVGQLLPTRGGILWVVAVTIPDLEEPWSATALDHAGRIVGRIVGPGPGLPLAFEDDRVVVRTEDRYGVAELRIYRLVPPAGTVSLPATASR
jgi:hypothetical protein